LSGDYDIIVAGGGVAALTAGLVAARLGRRTLILAGHVLGGNLLSIERIDGYPGFSEGVPGYELCPIAQAQAIEAGAEIETAELQRIHGRSPAFRLATGAGELGARAVIIATGSALKALGVPGEDRLKGKGVSHCASCDGPLLREATVAVIGGGDSALQEALTLAQHASRVLILNRGDTLSGQAAYRERVLRESRIEVRCGTVIEEILGAEAVSGVRLRGGEVVQAAAVFIYIGLEPNSGFLKGCVPLEPSGHIRTDSCMASAAAGVFAAGSVRAGWAGRAVASAGEGAAAAVAADRYLNQIA
jgi:thioredoxin reductase (NADPH)